jgi:hypothetical protein
VDTPRTWRMCTFFCTSCMMAYRIEKSRTEKHHHSTDSAHLEDVGLCKSKSFRGLAQRIAQSVADPLWVAMRR